MNSVSLYLQSIVLRWIIIDFISLMFDYDFTFLGCLQPYKKAVTIVAIYNKLYQPVSQVPKSIVNYFVVFHKVFFFWELFQAKDSEISQLLLNQWFYQSCTQTLYRKLAICGWYWFRVYHFLFECRNCCYLLNIFFQTFPQAFF